MTTVQHVHLAIELWGAVFCLISVIIVFLTRNFDSAGAGKLILLMLCSFLLLINDCAAWIFRGNTTEAGYYIVRVSNFCAFFFGFLMMPLLAEYISYLIERRSKIEGLMWKYVQWTIFFIGTALLVLNVFNDFMYSFDERNTYYRLSLSFLPGLIAFLGTAITLSVVIEYFKYLNKFEKVAMISFLILPLGSIAVQILNYGISFTYIALTVSTLILVISYIYNYTQYYIEKEKKLTEERIHLANQQIQPHFIFNSLSTIRFLYRKSQQEGEQAINEFSMYMRGCTDFMNEPDCIPAEREIDLVKHYVYFEQKRYGKKLAVEYDIQDTDFKIPPFAVQTSVENAIRHGLRGAVMENGLLKISTYRENNRHIVKIEDNGTGFDTEILNSDEGSHVGIKNTEERIRVMCKGEYSIESRPGDGTKVTIIIPD